MREYRERDADNARWQGFEFRPGDIIIDAPSKSGTTWTQLLVALLLFDGPDFPAPISRMSMWMEQQTRSVADAHAAFAAQTHRRFIKSHTPLDGVPERDDLFYVCAGRDPRDAAVSMVHHAATVNRDRFHELLEAQVGPREEAADTSETVQLSDEERRTRYFDDFLDDHDIPGWNIRFLAHHYRTFWDRRHRPNVELFHFLDYQTDLAAEMRRLAGFLEIELDDRRVTALAEEASIERARARAALVAPEAHLGIWDDPATFFRSGATGEWSEQMTEEQVSRYHRLVAELVGPDLADWVHHGRRHE